MSEILFVKLFISFIVVVLNSISISDQNRASRIWFWWWWCTIRFLCPVSLLEV